MQWINDKINGTPKKLKGYKVFYVIVALIIIVLCAWIAYCFIGNPNDNMNVNAKETKPTWKSPEYEIGR